MVSIYKICLIWNISLVIAYLITIVLSESPANNYYFMVTFIAVMSYLTGLFLLNKMSNRKPYLIRTRMSLMKRYLIVNFIVAIIFLVINAYKYILVVTNQEILLYRILMIIIPGSTIIGLHVLCYIEVIDPLTGRN